MFKWLVVDSEEVNNVGNDASSSERILQMVGEPEVEPDLQDSFTVTQVSHSSAHFVSFVVVALNVLSECDLYTPCRRRWQNFKVHLRTI